MISVSLVNLYTFISWHFFNLQLCLKVRVFSLDGLAYLKHQG